MAEPQNPERLLKVENLDGNQTVISDFVKRGGDWFEINFAETGSFQIFVIGVEISEVRP